MQSDKTGMQLIKPVKQKVKLMLQRIKTSQHWISIRWSNSKTALCSIQNQLHKAGIEL